MGFEVDKVAPEAWHSIPKDVYFQYIFPHLYPMAFEVFASWNNVCKNLVGRYYVEKLNAGDVSALVEKKELTLEDAKPQGNFYPGVVLHKRGNGALSSLFSNYAHSQFPENIGLPFEEGTPVADFVPYCVPEEIEEHRISEKEYKNYVQQYYLNLQLAIFTHAGLETLEICYKEMLFEEEYTYTLTYLIKCLIEFACNTGNQLAMYFLLFGEGPRGLEKMLNQEKMVEEFEKKLARVKGTNKALLAKCQKNGLSTKDVDWWFKHNRQAFFQPENSTQVKEKDIWEDVLDCLESYGPEA